MAKKSKKSIYKCGGKLADGGAVDLTKYAGLTNIGGNLLQSSNSAAGTIGGGMLSGAATGMALGPIGAGVGALIGGIGGIMKNKQNNEVEEMQRKMMMQQSNMQSLQNFQNANKMYREGGNVNPLDNQLTQYNGLQHEQGGLPIGQNTEVENGETRGIGTTENYVFSDTLKPDKKSKKTFADLSKSIEKKYANYDSDKFAKQSKDRELAMLMQEQEALKKSQMERDVSKLAAKYPELFQQLGSQTNQPQNPQEEQMEGLQSNPQEESQELQQGDMMRNGGGIHINPANKGKFTEYKERTGKTTQEALHSSNEHVREMAQFAANAKHFKHQYGGYIDDRELGGFIGDLNYLDLGGNINNQNPVLAGIMDGDPTDPTTWTPKNVNNIKDINSLSNAFLEESQGKYKNPYYLADVNINKKNLSDRRIVLNAGKKYVLVINSDSPFNIGDKEYEKGLHKIEYNPEKAQDIIVSGKGNKKANIYGALHGVSDLTKKAYGGFLDSGGGIGPGDDPTNPPTKKVNKYQRGSVNDYTPEALVQYNALLKQLHDNNPNIDLNEYSGNRIFNADNPEYIKNLNSNTPYNGEDREIGYYYPDIDNNRQYMGKSTEYGFINKSAEYNKMPVKYPITEKQFIANPDTYSAFMTPTRASELKQYLLGQKTQAPVVNAPGLTGNEVTNYVSNQLGQQEAPKINELDVQIKNRFGGYIKYANGGPLDLENINSPQTNFNISPETQLNMSLFNNRNQQSYPQSNQDNSYSRISSETPVGLSDTNGGIYNNKLEGVQNINYNTPGTYWNQKENLNKTFTPDSTYKYLTNELGVDPTFSKQLTSNPKLMQGYFDYVAQAAPESFYDKRKSLYPAYSKEQALGEKDRYGQHHQWTLDPEQLNNYKEFLNPGTPPEPLKNIPPGEFNVPPKPWDYNNHGGPPDGSNNNVPPQDNGGPPLGGNLKPFGPDWLATGLSTLPNIGMGIGNLNLANKLHFDRTHAEIMQPDYVDPTRAIQETRNQYAGVKNMIRQNAGSSGNYLSNILGATAGQSEAESGIQSKYDEANAGISNQSEQFNAQNKQHANDANAQIQMQEMMQKTNLKQQGYQNLSDAANTGINTYYQSKRDADKMNIAGGENFYYKRVGSLANQKPVKVFKGNGYHYYEDPATGQLRFLDPETGKQIKDTKKVNKFSNDLSSSKVDANSSQANKTAELQFAFSKMTPEQQQQFLKTYIPQ